MQEALQDVQQALDQLRQTVDAWNETYDHDQEQEQQPEQNELGNVRQDDQDQAERENDITHDEVYTIASSQINPPPGIQTPGSASTVIMSTLEMPLFKGGRLVFVRDAHVFFVGNILWLVVGL